jgi:hypothetical protein
MSYHQPETQMRMSTAMHIFCIVIKSKHLKQKNKMSKWRRRKKNAEALYSANNALTYKQNTKTASFIEQY